MTLAAKSELKAGGCGTYGEVIGEWMNRFEESQDTVVVLHELKMLVKALAENEQSAQALDGIACAILNRHYLETGLLYGCVAGELPSVMEQENQELRKIFHSAMLAD